MIISVPDILANSPKKLLRHYPVLMKLLWDRKQSKGKGLKAEYIPKLPILVLEGSRLGGKSQFAVRTMISSIIDGYASSAMFCTITEEGSKDSMQLIDKVLDEAEESIAKRRDSDRPIRILSHGETIYIDFLNKLDSKARQTEADILVLEELEKWNETAGNAALLTMVRHFNMIIVLSNCLPRWARVLFDSFGAEYDRIDYWENPALEQSIKDSLDKKKETDPDGWARDVMYVPTGGENRVFSEKLIQNIFLPHNSMFRPVVSILSIDVGAGGKDNSSVICLDMDANGVIEARLLMDESIASDILVQRVAHYRVDERADEEVWDAQGVGLGIMQFRAPRDNWDRMGIVPFGGRAREPNKYFNARAEAFMMTLDALQRGCLKVVNFTPQQQEDLIQEMRAITYRITEQARTNDVVQIEKKEIIKKQLGGLSPNKLDALVMGVWRLLTNQRRTPIYNNSSYEVKVTGVPTL